MENVRFHKIKNDKKLHGFSYTSNIAIFEAFCKNISLTTNFLFMKSAFISGKWFLTWCEAILKDQSVAKSEKKSIYTFQVYWQVHILKNQLPSYNEKWEMCFVVSTI